MNVIRLFMWGYQDSFQREVESVATKIFDQLDQDFKPQVLLFGVLTEELEERNPICFEPEDCGLKEEWFIDIKQQAEHYEAIDEERHYFHSNPLLQERHERRLKLKALHEALLEILNSRNSISKRYAVFCSYPILVSGYRVFVVLKLNEDCYQKYYSLNTTHLGREEIPTSLVDAVITEYFLACQRALRQPDPGADLLTLEREPNEIINLGGGRLMYTPALKSERWNSNYALFGACNAISALPYEGQEGRGSIIIAPHDHPNVVQVIRFIHPILFQNHKAVRKILELCSQDESLIADSTTIYGLGHIVGRYDTRREDLFHITFMRQYSWQLLHDDHIMMIVEHNQADLPKPSINETKFKLDAKRIFKTIESKYIDLLLELINAAIKQKHGTLVVIIENAQNEAERLAKQSTVIQPIQLTPDLMNLVTAIDGAVLLSPDATCYAIGVILDGMATPKGNPARGARYNSAIRYVESQNQCLAIVVSEDGGVNLIPNLMPQIRKSDLLRHIEIIGEVYNSENRDRKAYYASEEWLRSHQFYISKEQCDELNILMREITRGFLRESGWCIEHNDLLPHEDMNDSYFITEE